LEQLEHAVTYPPGEKVPDAHGTQPAPFIEKVLAGHERVNIAGE
jgi:hypothetical protein